MNVEILKLTENDLEKLIEQIKLYAAVFETPDFKMPAAAYLQTLLEKKEMIFYAALFGGEIVGGLTAFVLPSVYVAASEIYLYDLAVKTEYQRQGIGTRLIAALKSFCAAHEHKGIFVQADAVDQHAIDFYRKTGAAAADVVHFSYIPTDKNF